MVHRRSSKTAIWIIIFGSLNPAQGWSAQIESSDSVHRSSVVARIKDNSSRYLGTTYEWGPGGEGPDGVVSNKPIMNFGPFDCTTYVETVMAQSIANTSDADVVACVHRNIKYAGGEVSYLTRNHLTESDWIPNLEKTGIVKDITKWIGGEQTASEFSHNKRRDWIRSLTADVIERVPGSSMPSAREKQAIVDDLHKAADRYDPNERVNLDYLPIDLLLKDADLRKKLSDGAIVNIVRSGSIWPVHGGIRDVYTIVSHQGFIIMKGGVPYLRSALMKWGGKTLPEGPQVIDKPLRGYLAEMKKDLGDGPGSVLGINILRVTANPPILSQCQH